MRISDLGFRILPRTLHISPLFIALTVFFLSSCVRNISPSASLDRGESIRIAVLKGITNVKVEGAGIGEADGHSFTNENNPLFIELGESGVLTFNGSAVSGPSITFISEDEIIYVNGRKFRGKIEIINDQKGLLVINELPLEFYVVGLINHEISSKWPMEAVKAQAVIARTYALYQKKRKGNGLYHMEGTVANQVYAGSITEDDRSFYAVKETMGVVLVYDGELALTVYHSNGGGMTEDSKNVWGKDYPYLKQVRSPFDEDFPSFSWVLDIHLQSVEAALKDAGYLVTNVQEILPLSKTPSGRVTRVMIRHDIGDLEMSGEDLRKIIGYDRLKSTMFDVEKAGDSFVFRGKGSGHGVGLSQWGAKGMAEQGYTYREILEHYYPGTQIEKAY